VGSSEWRIAVTYFHPLLATHYFALLLRVCEPASLRLERTARTDVGTSTRAQHQIHLPQGPRGRSLCDSSVSGRSCRCHKPRRRPHPANALRDAAALRVRLRHDDLTHYNAVQKVLYLGVMVVGVLIVLSGLALCKPVQFSELADLFGSFQPIRLVHFLCMSAIVALALLVPQSLVAMVTGGPVLDEPRNGAPRATPVVAELQTVPEIKTVPEIEPVAER